MIQQNIEKILNLVSEIDQEIQGQYDPTPVPDAPLLLIKSITNRSECLARWAVEHDIE